MNTESYIHKLSLIGGSVVFLLYLFTFSMLSESRWRYLADYGDGPTVFIVPAAYFAIGILLVFWLISFCISIVKLIGDSNSLNELNEKQQILQSNLIRHLRIIGITLIAIVALDLLPSDEADDDIALMMIGLIIFSIPVIIAVFDFVLPRVNNLLLPRWTYAGWFSVIGLGALLAVPLANFQEASQFSVELFSTLQRMLSGDEQDLQTEYFIIACVYLLLTSHYLYKSITQWNKIKADIYALFRKAVKYIFRHSQDRINTDR